MAHGLEPDLGFATDSPSDSRQHFVLLQCLSLPISEMDTINPNVTLTVLGLTDEETEALPKDPPFIFCTPVF